LHERPQPVARLRNALRLLEIAAIAKEKRVYAT
jgi:hypothetical protein